MKNQIKKITQSSLLKAILVFCLILVGNILLRPYFFRIDLTEDQRFSISPQTTELIKNLEDELTITIYLDGDLNQGFRQLKNATEDLMRIFNMYGKSKVSYQFSSPDKVSDPKKKKALFASLESQGMTAVNVVEEGSNGKIVQKPVFPWASIRLKGKTYPVPLLVNIPGKNGTENLNYSIQNLEFQFTDAIRILSTTEPRKIAFIEGHGELSEDQVYDVSTALSHYYQVDRGVIGNNPDILLPYDAVIIAHPQRPFSEKDKFVLDQYFMSGGKILWFVDGVSISMDSLSTTPSSIAMYNDINLEDLLFRYGVRINPVLIQDMQCALVPINFATPGQKADFHPAPWIYSPILSSSNHHPITTNISPVKGVFASSLDTVGTFTHLKRDFLLRSSAQSNIIQAPAPVDLSIAVANLDSRNFKHGAQTVALIQEGIFPSAFKNRNAPSALGISRSAIQTQSIPTRMMVVADGDILRNEVEGVGQSKQIFPLNLDRYTKQELYGNKEFVVNAVNYLCDGDQWMKLRNRQFHLRLLNKVEANEKRAKWQLMNILIPIALLVITGSVLAIVRRRKYAKRP